MDNSLPVYATLTTPSAPGAIALISVQGQPEPLLRVLEQITGRTDWPAGRLFLTPLAHVDDGLAGRIADQLAWLMPHGSTHGVARILQSMQELGVQITDHMGPADAYPEASDDVEAAMLATLPHCVSPRAVDRLLEQPEIWRNWRREWSVESGRRASRPQAQDQARQILDQAHRWRLLLEPPTVCVVGAANVGKSTLTNRLAGHSAAVVADVPGTTRDWVGAAVLLQGIAVNWLDTPGLRDQRDDVESQAIELARPLIQQADCVVAMRDSQSDWPDPDDLPRTPDLWLQSKADLLGSHATQQRHPTHGQSEAHDDLEHSAGDQPDSPLRISAHSNQGVAALTHRVIEVLCLTDALTPSSLPWAFTRSLREQVWQLDQPAR